MNWTSGILAEFVAETKPGSLPPEVVSAVKNAWIDLIGCAAAGAATETAAAARRIATELFAEGSSPIWFAAASRRAEAAAMANSTAASALDLDDGHRLAAGHPGAAIVPSVLAVGAATNADGPRLLVATAVGYEVAVRVAAARDLSRLDTLSTGRWCAFGVVAAAASLAGDSPATTAQALAIAGTLSPGLSPAGYSSLMGNQVKEGIPWAVLTGLSALELARNGYTGPLDVLDHSDYFDARAIADGLGESFAVSSVYFKPYACCRWIHAAIDALAEIAQGDDWDLESIRSIEVHTFERAGRLTNDTNPDSLESAQYSLPFCLAVAAVGGGQALCPLAESWLQDQRVVTLAEKVKIVLDPDMERRFPAEAGARVVVDAGARRSQRSHRYALGDPGRPMSEPQLRAKFRLLATGCLSSADQDTFLNIIGQLERLDHPGILGTILGKIPPAWSRGPC